MKQVKGYIDTYSFYMITFYSLKKPCKVTMLCVGRLCLLVPRSNRIVQPDIAYHIIVQPVLYVYLKFNFVYMDEFKWNNIVAFLNQ